jgi:hypothetical protein
MLASGVRKEGWLMLLQILDDCREGLASHIMLQYLRYVDGILQIEIGLTSVNVESSTLLSYYTAPTHN